MSTIEPTEEQRAAAIRLWSRAGPTGYGMAAAVEDIARLLAEREAKLREELRGEWARLVEAREVTAMIVEGHQLRARVAELESEVRIAWADCADGSCEACAKCVDQAKHQRDFATARVAELEARLARAVDIIVSEELDRDFGEEPTPRILAVRALLTECGYQPERCSFGAIIGYSGTVDDIPEMSEEQVRAELAADGVDIDAAQAAFRATEGGEG